MTAKEVRTLGNSEMKPKDRNQGVEALVDAASNFPFRPDARRFVVLFTGPNVSVYIYI